MSDELELQDTPAVEVDEVTTVDENQAEPEVKEDEPFLPVNDRTVYRTREDAVRGYNAAANRIQELSQWEKSARTWGLADPAQLDAVANELLQLRREKAEAAAQSGKRNVESRVDPADPKAKEAAQVKEYMRQFGYVSKAEQDEALKELRDFMAEQRQQGAQSLEQRFDTQEADARDDVAGYLATDGFRDDGSGMKLAIVGTLIKDWINGSDERIAEWSRGGRAAQALVKEGYGITMRGLEWKAAATTAGLPKPTDPGYAEAKAKALAQNKKLPAQGVAKERSQDGRYAKTNPKQKGHINSELHEKAWQMIQTGAEE